MEISFLDVPKDVMRLIFYNLDLNDIRQCFRVSKHFLSSTQDVSFFMWLCIRFGVSVYNEKPKKFQKKTLEEMKSALRNVPRCFKASNIDIRECTEIKVLTQYNTNYSIYSIKYVSSYKDIDPIDMVVVTGRSIVRRTRLDFDARPILDVVLDEKDCSFFQKFEHFLTSFFKLPMGHTVMVQEYFKDDIRNCSFNLHENCAFFDNKGSPIKNVASDGNFFHKKHFCHNMHIKIDNVRLIKQKIYWTCSVVKLTISSINQRN